MPARKGYVAVMKLTRVLLAVLILALALLLLVPSNTRAQASPTWSPMSSGNAQWIFGVWGSSASDVYAAVGYDGKILHFDGNAWSVATSWTSYARYFTAIWGSSSSDVFAVGGQGQGAEYSTIWHYDGSTWSEMYFGAQFSGRLQDVWGSSSTDVFAVGRDYYDSSTILHYNGTSWNSMTSGATGFLSGVWGSSASDVFTVGSGGKILHYDGSAWSAMTSGTTNDLYGVWGTSSSDVFAVGSGGTILHYDGTWDPMSSGSTEDLSGVWGSSSSSVFAVGSSGTILHYSSQPNQPSNTSPSDGATDVSLTPTLQSSAFSDPDAGDTHGASQWQITTASGDYSSPVFDSGTDSSNLTSIPIPSGNLSGNTAYYWQVRHQDNYGNWSGWSEETSFTTLNHAPNTPSNASPGNGATGVSLTPMLQSSAFSDPDSGDTHAASQWQITTSSGNYSSPVFNSTSGSDLTQITVPSGNLSYNTTYYWHVRHQDNHGAWSSYSAETSFITLNRAPDQPSNVSPADGETDVSLTPTLQSSAFSDPDSGDTHAASQWQITMTSGDYSNPVFDSGTDTSNLTQITLAPETLPGYRGYTTYYWRVRHQDNYWNWSDWSVETSFTAEPDLRDSDDDGLSNYEEVETFGTDPLKADTDGDGLSDAVEITVFGTDPLKADTDGDGIDDGLEAAATGLSADVDMLQEGWIRVNLFWSDYTMKVETSSTVLGVTFDSESKELAVNVGGDDGTQGECDIAIPKDLVSSGPDIMVYLDGQPIEFTLTEDDSYYYVHVEYHHSLRVLKATFAPVSEIGAEQLPLGLPIWAWIAIGAGAILIVGFAIARLVRR